MKKKNPRANYGFLIAVAARAKKYQVKSEINDYVWSPDGKKILLVMRDADYSDTSLKDKARDPL